MSVSFNESIQITLICCVPTLDAEAGHRPSMRTLRQGHAEAPPAALAAQGRICPDETENDGSLIGFLTFSFKIY